MANQFIKSEPDYRRLLKIIDRDGLPDRVPTFEIALPTSVAIMKRMKELDPTFEPLWTPDPSLGPKDMRARVSISAMYAGGYDYVTLIPDFDFRTNLHKSEASSRGFLITGDQMIKTREDFKNYDWPDVSKEDFGVFKLYEQYMPKGMKTLMYSRGPHIALLYLLGYEGMCYLLEDDEELFMDIMNEACERLYELYARCAKEESVFALMIAEDFGFTNNTFLPPEFLRKTLLPWHKKVAKVCHENNKRYILHSCGYNDSIMEDIIDCGIDAKHSYEDKITPIWEYKKRWGDRIGLLGGFDMNKLGSFDTQHVKEHVKFMMDNCKAGGGWALGSGNSVADYVPVDNYITMIQEGYKLGQY